MAEMPLQGWPDIDPGRWVGCDFVLDVVVAATAYFSVAPSRTAGTLLEERWGVSLDGLPWEWIPRVIDSPHGGRLHVLDLPVGRFEITYDASLTAGTFDAAQLSDEAEILGYRRPSRYCPSDRLAGFAQAELGYLPPGQERLDATVLWVARRLAYVVGASGPLDTAVETLLAGQGVCRDYAHLLVAMCRALDMPARMASVYAPGLSPMDFHAVAEVYVDGVWQVFDATYLAPRQSLVRIATGRDAADTAFLDVIGGDIRLPELMVRAGTSGALPRDPTSGPVLLR
jgi:transglutaminase-like putative cysteine protease